MSVEGLFTYSVKSAGFKPQSKVKKTQYSATPVSGDPGPNFRFSEWKIVFVIEVA